MKSPLHTLSSVGIAGFMAFFLSQCSSSKEESKGTAAKTPVKAKVVEEGCYQDGPNCLPPIDLMDVSGKVWTPDSLAGKVVIINFWASWCKPCQHEIPDLAKVQRKYKDQDVVILGLITDEPGDAKLKAFRERYGLDYPVVRVDQEISQAFGSPRNLPTNFVYSRGGHLMFDRPGAISASALEREIKELL